MATERKVSQGILENPELQPYIIPHLVPTDERLGEKDGSYGFAKKVKLNGMLFAAKIIHKHLIQPKSVVVENYIKECQIIATIHHTNIVQFVGLCNLPSESELPLLVMELMDSNLHDYLLDDANANIPLTIKQSMLEDVARGLSYLHNFRVSGAIIHRDLTASNVLLDSALNAKISDFGNSRFLPKDFNPAKLSKMPGTMIYMPPEAITQHYDTKLDIFSFGHLALFTLTQVFPDDLLPHVHSVKGEPNLAARSEVERRRGYIDIMVGGLSSDENHPLVMLVKECLANEPEKRPIAEDLVRRLQQKGYSKQLIHVTKELEKVNMQLQETSSELQAMKEQFGSIMLSQNGGDNDQQRQQEPQVLQDPPIHMTSHPQVVVMDDKVYLGGGYATPEDHAATVLMFDSQGNTWSTPFPKCPTKYFGLAVINGSKLAIVAGTEYSSHTKTGYVYTWDLTSEQPQTEWKQLQCTSMLNYRSLVSVVSYRNWLIAVGGEGRDGRLIDAVEKLDTEAEPNKCHWSTCAKLSTKSIQTSLSIVDDKLFAFCTSNKVPTSRVGMPSNTVFWASLDQLLESNKDTPQAEVWHEIKHLPIKSSTALSFKGSLYALGGIEKNSFRNVSKYVYKYDQNAGGDESPSAVWKKVGELPFPVYQCATTQLGDEIFLYGKSNEHEICVYIYTFN